MRERSYQFHAGLLLTTVRGYVKYRAPCPVCSPPQSAVFAVGQGGTPPMYITPVVGSACLFNNYQLKCCPHEMLLNWKYTNPESTEKQSRFLSWSRVSSLDVHYGP